MAVNFFYFKAVVPAPDVKNTIVSKPGVSCWNFYISLAVIVGRNVFQMSNTSTYFFLLSLFRMHQKWAEYLFGQLSQEYKKSVVLAPQSSTWVHDLSEIFNLNAPIFVGGRFHATVFCASILTRVNPCVSKNTHNHHLYPRYKQFFWYRNMFDTFESVVLAPYFKRVWLMT